ncbi:hypothetical protein F511_13942 [Dorcoceras hygrometricum]|uniref:WAT1-related protein n=1 Tax=Dorcoceras hygrometricum TaxID=472368 RepID=A0A2Z7AW25_9LAMI|nr:hypothetical protein F511_13942 [Dorcoceras hygrometricum]
MRTAHLLFHKARPFLAVIFLQAVLAGMNIITKAALNKGMSNYVFVVYRHVLATVVIAPFAVVLDRLEKIRLMSISSQAKIIGTLATVAGAMIMTLVEGPNIGLPWTKQVSGHAHQQSQKNHQHSIKGAIMITTGCFSWACFMIFQDSVLMFQKSSKRDFVTWNAMVCAYAHHGLAEEALQIFENMQLEKVMPHRSTFVAVLRACAHIGLVENALHYFNLMQTHYGLEPQLEHFSSMVEILGRSGRLVEALELI